ncbi:hypothetical protein HOT49_gp296 [Erwinia phage vB_EamM_Alexandra]|uniref:Uncharacterized protein n=1 Tax=Erwinia phage vB_EamM_Alexandra TaxID=2201424 RepID=A0A2Z4QE61_9CAUD|nr:hypothetical protein HOT49_gp296 [Erwinia phage vB_EamM_Alexandra]AWY08555.1 hypothetical protein Alexandra_299 [Erwinia phage vB_EamM_Alexandra]
MFTTTTIAKKASSIQSANRAFGISGVTPSNRISCIWPGALDIPADIKRWCRANEITNDLDAYMRVRFKGRRADILNLVARHLAPNNPDMAVRILATITEA